jgi:hypothetical protein
LFVEVIPTFIGPATEAPSQHMTRVCCFLRQHQPHPAPRMSLKI